MEFLPNDRDKAIYQILDMLGKSILKNISETALCLRKLLRIADDLISDMIYILRNILPKPENVLKRKCIHKIQVSCIFFKRQ